MSVETMQASLRRLIKDDRFGTPAFTISCTDPETDSALFEITNDSLIITPTGGVAPAVNLSFTSPLYDTVGKVQNYFESIDAYSAVLAQGADEGHPSVDLEPTAPVDIAQGEGYDVRTRLFANSQLTDILNRAAMRHNPATTAATTAPGEEPMVLHLAQAEIFRVLANDSLRRKGMDLTVEQALKVAESFERAYDGDRERLMRVLAPLQETSKTVGVGDVMVGDIIRQSLRSGAAWPMTAPLMMSTPIDWAPATEQLVGDVWAEVKWTRNRNTAFRYLELWRDTHPNVTRTANQVTNPSTSKLVAVSYSHILDRYRDEDLEPETDYYYKVVHVDSTGEIMESPVLSIRTLKSQVRFITDGSAQFAPLFGPAGTPLALRLDPLPEDPQEAYVFEMDGKNLPGALDLTGPVPVWNTEVPAFTHKGLKTVTIRYTAASDIRTDVARTKFNVT